MLTGSSFVCKPMIKRQTAIKEVGLVQDLCLFVCAMA